MTVKAIARFIQTPFTVWDNTTVRGIFSAGCGDACTDDMPASVGNLEAIQVYACNDMIYIDVRTGNDGGCYYGTH